MELALTSGFNEKMRTEILYNHVFFATTKDEENKHLNHPSSLARINKIFFSLTRTLFASTIVYTHIK